MLTEQYIKLIEKWCGQGVSVAGITSLLYIVGYKDEGNYFAVRKKVIKEVSRIKKIQ